MTGARADSNPEASPQPDDIRNKLEDLVCLELHGPAGGRDEEIDESRVMDRYLVGMLAPKQQYSGQERDEAFEEGTSSSNDGGAKRIWKRVPCGVSPVTSCST